MNLKTNLCKVYFIFEVLSLRTKSLLKLYFFNTIEPYIIKPFFYFSKV